MIQPSEWYVAFAFDLRDAEANGTTTEIIMRQMRGLYFTKMAKNYSDDKNAPWPPDAAWCDANLAAGGMP